MTLNVKYNIKKWIIFTPISKLRKILKYSIVNLKNYLNNKPKLKRKILNILDYMPTIKHRLQRVGVKQSHSNIFLNELKSELDLSPNAREIYQRLNPASTDENN